MATPTIQVTPASQSAVDSLPADLKQSAISSTANFRSYFISGLQRFVGPNVLAGPMKSWIEEVLDTYESEIALRIANAYFHEHPKSTDDR